MLICPEYQANTDTCQPQYSEQECCTTAFPIVKQLYKQAVSFRDSHDRLKHLIYQKSAKEVSNWNREELKRVPGGKYPALNVYWDIQTVDGVQIRIHPGNGNPAKCCTKAPDLYAVSEGKEKVLRTHGKHQAIPNGFHPALRRGRKGGQNTANQHGNANDGIDHTHHRFRCF